MKTSISAQRVIDAPADVVYHCIADYREHHRPSGFLPPAFSDMEIAQGGVGAGTHVSWLMKLAGQTRRAEAVISEPDPGHILVETGPSVVTTFTVQPAEHGALVRFDTTIDEGGIQGLMNRLLAPRLLRPLYADELSRLEEYARAHGPITHTS